MAVSGTSQVPLPPSTNSNPPSSTHRLPTVSATQALRILRKDGPRALSSGVQRLDTILANPTKAGNRTTPGGAQVGGFTRGTVTEIWGPAGAGKTAMAMQTTALALKTGSGVVWIDAFSPMVRPRFEAVLAATVGSADQDSLMRFHQFHMPTFAHLLGLIVHSTEDFPPANTASLVIDGLNTLVDFAYPRYSSSSHSNKGEAAKWAAGRRYSVLGTLMGSIKKMAALHDLAVIVTTGCVTRVRPGLGTTLVPGVGGSEWDNGVTNRLVLFRDFAVRAQDNGTKNGNAAQQIKSARYVGVEKLGGTEVAEGSGIEHVFAFTVDSTGLRGDSGPPIDAEEMLSSLPRPLVSPTKSRKRAYAEIADSDDEVSSEYGWLAEDEVAAEGLIDEPTLDQDDESEAIQKEHGKTIKGQTAKAP